MRIRPETNVGLLFALVLVGAMAYFSLSKRFDLPLAHGTTVYALFPEVRNLHQGALVRMGGVIVGRVESMSLVPEQQSVRVRMRITAPEKVRTDSVASIETSPLSAESQLILTSGSASGATVQPNTYLNTVATTDFPSLVIKLDSAADGLDKLVRSFPPGMLDDISQPILGLLETNAVPLNRAIDDMALVTGEIAEGRGTIGQMMMGEPVFHDEALVLVENIGLVAGTTKTFTLGLKSIFVDARAGRGNLGLVLTQNGLYDEATSAMGGLRILAEKMNTGPGMIAMMVNDSSLYNNLKITIPRVENSVEGIEDQGPTFALGIAIGFLIPKN